MSFVNCLICKKEFKARKNKGVLQKYCSSKCMGRGYYKPRKECICKTCGIKFIAKHLHTKGFFCSIKCLKYTGPYESLVKNGKSKAIWNKLTEEQKWERIKKIYESKVIKQDGCWSWKGYKGAYGAIYVGKGKLESAHRVSYRIHKGTIPSDKIVLHSCDNTICSNPEHLFLGTYLDNTNDMFKKGRSKTPFGINHYQAKLTEKDIPKIRNLISQKESLYKIAKLFGVARATIQNIFYNKTWKHVE